MELIKKLKALGDETRLRILNILRYGPLCVCEIEDILQITQSNASRHLNKLMNADLVTYYKEAKYVYYKLDEETLREFSFIEELLSNELEKEEILKQDYNMLKAYKGAGINCETINEAKDILLNTNNKK
ncbi:ArsR/SmtB family transcription factor [Terrisporobacter vanillatitrophus]|uniref:ArsR/SmtB family transcription factor n=1 Tax=Terrisporobacter vanillatitrophus TaxID=3058402 RepID=UPI003365E058